MVPCDEVACGHRRRMSTTGRTKIVHRRRSCNSKSWTADGRPTTIGGNQERETRVGILMVRCATTGKDVPTGIEMDRLTLELTPAFNGTILCPLCEAEHRWSK